ncbi:NlpC/P60 family protein [Corynebacterium lubricantis]|uniref:C40 family peptidase n=1 Tax=Corynebacterium lubricantis TaxID=541095 RepID=UPI0003799B7C|nr:C40 family peptidase [Corynebacterium lubricantis]
MGKHRATSRRYALVASSVATAVVAGTIVVPAQADEVDDLIQEMEAISQQAGAKNEAVKQLEIEIEQAQGKLDALGSEAAAANAAVQDANKSQTGFQGDVDGIAASKYRNVQNDSLVTTMESGNPQTVIDRAAYLGAISRNTERTLGELQDATLTAADRANAANIAVVEAEFYRNQLDAKYTKLDQERSSLESQVTDMEQRIDSLSEEQRRAWEEKDNPIEVPNPAIEMPGSSTDAPAGASAAASSAVSAALSKLGSPYGWGAAGPDAFDCSGLMYWAYQQQGKSIPRTSQAQLAGGQSVSTSDLQPGDIIGYYPGVTHVGMYIGNGQVVHASDYGIPVQVVPYDSMPIQGASRY